MYSKIPNYVIGFHGCDKSTRDKIISDQDIMRHSYNNYDWLDHGVYFWEYNYNRALEFANYIKNNANIFNTKITEPSVLGAIIDLGYCFNLVDSEYLHLLKKTYNNFKLITESAGNIMPVNKRTSDSGHDYLLRPLDCAVIEFLHTYNKQNNHTPFHSVRGVFWEGKELYDGAGFKEKNHIQICIRNPNYIKGFFIPRNKDNDYEMP